MHSPPRSWKTVNGVTTRSGGGRIDFDALLSTLLDTNTNTYGLDLEVKEDYLDLVLFLNLTKSLKIAGKQLRVWVVLHSPSHSCRAGTCSGCANRCTQSPPVDSPLAPFNDTARFNCTLVAVHLDDFSDESNLEGGHYGVYTPDSLARMRQGLAVGQVALIGGMYYTRAALNHSVFPGIAAGTTKNLTFTLDVYPWLAQSIDGVLLYFLNSKQGMGPCAPAPGQNSSCAGLHSPWPDRYDDCCTAGACAERTVENMLPELSDFAARLLPTQSLHLLLYSTGSGCGVPSVKYTADALATLLPRVDGAQPTGLFPLDGVVNYVLTGFKQQLR